MRRTLGRRGRAAFAVALGTALAGCYTSVGKWTYPSGRYPTSECPHPAPAIVAVEPLIVVQMRRDAEA